MVFIIFILQVSKWWLREVKRLSPGHTGSEVGLDPE